MPLDKVLSASIANAAVNASAISNTANLVIGALNTGNTVVTGTANVSSTLGVAGALSSGNTTITGNLYSNTIALNLAGSQNTLPISVVLTSNGDFLRLSSATAANLTSNGGVVHVFGKADTLNNIGYIGFKHLSDSSNNNYVTIGMHSRDHILQINGNREVSANAANMYVGGTGERHHLRIASNNWPEIRYTTPTRDEVIRLGVAHADDAVTYNVQEGDWYVYTNSINAMPLIVRRATNTVVVNQYMSMPANPKFWAWSSASPIATSGTTLPFNQVSLNIGSCFNTSTYKFTAPVAGYYEFNAMGLFRQANYSGSGELSFYINGTNVSSRGMVYAGGGSGNIHTPCHLMYRVYLNANDAVDVGCQRIDSSGVDFYMADRLAWFSGHKIG